MTTSATPLKKVLSDEHQIPKHWLSYFRESLRSALHGALLERFQEANKAGSLTKARLALKLGKRPEQITRWLTAPGNLELDTISDLALALGGIPSVEIRELFDRKPSNQVHILMSLSASEASDESVSPTLRRTQTVLSDHHIAAGMS